MPHQKPFALCTLKIGTAAGELLLHPPLHRIVQALRVPHEEHLHRAPACGRELLGLDTKIKAPQDHDFFTKFDEKDSFRPESTCGKVFTLGFF